jgi:ketosteroid isomerase-like protein
MNRIAIFAALAVICIAGAALRASETARAPKQTTEELLMERDREWAQSAISRDLAAFRSFMADDYVEIVLKPATSTQKAAWVTMTKDEWSELLRSGRENYQSVELRNQKVYLQDNVATIIGEYSQKGTKDGADNSDEGLYVETWVRRRGVWLVLSSTFP